MPVKAETIEDVIEAMNNGDNSINGCQLPPEDCFFINDDCADVQGEILTLQDWADRSWDLTY